MGRGDIKTTKGKRFKGSYGNTRRRSKAEAYVPVVTEKKQLKL